MIDLSKMFTTHGMKPRGVIHVGAHHGNELEGYLKMGFERVLFLEANPALIDGLKAKADMYPGKVSVVHVAALDCDGSVMLKLTSMDQSSSVLTLSKHKEIYPTIVEVGQVEVPARKLDTLLAEVGLRPGDFNFLNIDVQGAELMVLRGAENLLNYIEAINTEVNLVELYSGSALLPDIELFLASKGLYRAAMVTPAHPSWGDAFYLRKPVVSMTSLGQNGQFGNQIIQYIFLRLVAKRRDAIVQTPPWIGQELFGFDDPVPVLQFPYWVDPAMTNWSKSIIESQIIQDWHDFLRKDINIVPAFTSTDFIGFFTNNSSDYAYEKDFIRGLFRFLPRFEEDSQKKLNSLKAVRRKVLAVHLRRGDFGYDHFYRAPCVWYERWIQEKGFNPDEWLIYICSETPEPYQNRFKGFRVMSGLDFETDAKLAPYLDFYIMTKADYILASNSSFSFVPAMLNDVAEGFARPNIELEGLENFDPWNAEVFQKKELSPQEHARLIAID